MIRKAKGCRSFVNWEMGMDEMNWSVSGDYVKAIRSIWLDNVLIHGKISLECDLSNSKTSLNN
jgi:hypothetical protein